MSCGPRRGARGDKGDDGEHGEEAAVAAEGSCEGGADERCKGGGRMCRAPQEPGQAAVVGGAPAVGDRGGLEQGEVAAVERRSVVANCTSAKPANGSIPWRDVSPF
ncbi:hypothetical protein GCM10010244_54850 [Streptomyces coeruleorubidus]|nr:hypothetical protein GCM10010244_54850 [Streptomyces bellus]